MTADGNTVLVTDVKVCNEKQYAGVKNYSPHTFLLITGEIIMKTLEKKYRIAIQKDGKLKDSSLELLSKIGLYVPADLGRKLTYRSPDAPFELIFLRNRDIPYFVHTGAVDFAFVGEDVLAETICDVDVLARCDFGDCTLSIAVPNESGINSVNDLIGKRIATSYPNALRRYLCERNIDAIVIPLKGGCEVAPLCGLSDAICEIVQTGETLFANNLKILEHILFSSASLVKQRSVTQESAMALFGPIIKELAKTI